MELRTNVQVPGGGNKLSSGMIALIKILRSSFWTNRVLVWIRLQRDSCGSHFTCQHVEQILHHVLGIHGRMLRVVFSNDHHGDGRLRCIGSEQHIKDRLEADTNSNYVSRNPRIVTNTVLRKIKDDLENNNDDEAGDDEVEEKVEEEVGLIQTSDTTTRMLSNLIFSTIGST